MFGIDIASLDTTTLSEEGVAMAVRDPRVKRDWTKDDDDRPFLYGDAEMKQRVTITVLGPDSPRVARLLAPQKARFQTQALASQSRRGAKISPEDALREDQENIDIAVAATVTWVGFLAGGAPFPCTAENARALYTSNRDVCDQVIAFVRERANFLPAK